MWWTKKPKKKTLWDKIIEIRMTLFVLTSLISMMGGLYGYIKPDFSYFKKSEVKAVVVGQPNSARSLFVQIMSDRIPNVPVTISFTLDGVDIAHRHYSLGIPSIKGVHFEEGKATWVEPIPLLFSITNPKLTIRFSFQGIKTLLVPEVMTFTTTLLDGNQT